MNISVEGALALRNAIIEQACCDYVEARKFLIKNPKAPKIAKKNKLYGKAWSEVLQAHKNGEMPEEEFLKLKKRHDKTLLAKNHKKNTEMIKEVTKWFGSQQFLSFNLDLDKETIIKKLEERAAREIAEGRKPHSKKRKLA